MKTIPAIIAALTLAAHARPPLYDPPATSTDAYLERQQNERIIEQNERMIALQQEAARKAESARLSAELDASIARLRQQNAEGYPHTPAAPSLPVRPIVIPKRPQPTTAQLYALAQRTAAIQMSDLSEAKKSELIKAELSKYFPTP